MKWNETGFTYPLTLSLLLVLSTILIIYTDQYLAEKKIVKETETILKTEYYLLYCVRNLETRLQNDEQITSGELLLRDGRINYSNEDLGTSQKITINLRLNTGENIIGFAYYNKNVKKMIKWVEKN